MRRSRTKVYKLVKRVVTKDSEGVPEVSYSGEKSVRGEVWAARDQLQVATYGDRTNNILNMRMYGSYAISNNKGVMEYNLGIDGGANTYTGTVEPTLENAPANDWTDNDKAKHIGDVYYIVEPSSEKNGYIYRFVKEERKFKLPPGGYLKFPDENHLKMDTYLWVHIDNFMLTAGDGVCVYADTPDYKVVSIKAYQHLLLELEKL